MNRQAHTLIEDIEKAIKKAKRNTTCLYPGCTEQPIGSHVVARKTLKLIAERSEVLTWLPTSAWDMARTLKAGKSLEHLNLEPVRVGIGDRRKITDPLFCQDHDGKIFAPLEVHHHFIVPRRLIRVERKRMKHFHIFLVHYTFSYR